MLQILSGITQQQQDENMQKSALRALQSWLHFDISDDPNVLGIHYVQILFFFFFFFFFDLSYKFFLDHSTGNLNLLL